MPDDYDDTVAIRAPGKFQNPAEQSLPRRLVQNLRLLRRHTRPLASSQDHGDPRHSKTAHPELANVAVPDPVGGRPALVLVDKVGSVDSLKGQQRPSIDGKDLGEVRVAGKTQEVRVMSSVNTVRRIELDRPKKKLRALFVVFL